MALDIFQSNLRSWETLELGTLIVGLLRTAGAYPYPVKNLTGIRKTTPFYTAVDEILLTQKVSAINHEAPEFLDSDYDANDLYEVDKMSIEDILKK